MLYIGREVSSRHGPGVISPWIPCEGQANLLRQLPRTARWPCWPLLTAGAVFKCT